MQAAVYVSTPSLVLDSMERRGFRAVELVVGDVVALEEGQAVPADARVIESAELQVDEAPLTGESVPVYKRPDALDDPRTPLADRGNMVYRGTNVTSGNALVVVAAFKKRRSNCHRHPCISLSS